MQALKLLGVMIIALTVSLISKEWNLNNKNLVESFGLGIVGKKIDIYDHDALGEWALKTYYNKKYYKTRNDEFEYNDAKEWALKAFKKRISMIKLPNTTDDIHLYLRAEFGKYDFRKQRFPISGLTADSYVGYRGNDKVVSGYNNSRLTMINADAEKNFLPMDKATAKSFLRSRKDSGGYIDRGILLHYVYHLKSAEENREFSPSEDICMTLNFKGVIKYIEVMDRDRKQVYYRILFPNPNESQNTSNQAEKNKE